MTYTMDLSSQDECSKRQRGDPEFLERKNSESMTERFDLDLASCLGDTLHRFGD